MFHSTYIKECIILAYDIDTREKHQAGIEPTGLQYIPTKRFQLSVSTTAFHLVYINPQHKTHDAISTPMASEALGRG